MRASLARRRAEPDAASRPDKSAGTEAPLRFQVLVGWSNSQTVVLAAQQGVAPISEFTEIQGEPLVEMFPCGIARQQITRGRYSEPRSFRGLANLFAENRHIDDVG